ncbi:MAG: EamA family transporter [Candidatus Cloacimonetes bacterium]|nr:EamA family transporter [Candidatus Cloacimonadota bacterium]
MIFLFFSILCSVLIANLLVIFRKDENSDILFIFLGNYFFASIFSYVTSNTSLREIGAFDIILGVITGILFLCNFIIYQKNIIINGLSLSVGVMRIAILIPILISIFFFLEKIIFLNYLGIVIVFASFIFMTELKTFRKILWILGLFLITGVSETALKIYKEFGLSDTGFFIFLLFGTAFIFNLVLIFSKKRTINFRSFGYGLILGIPNQLTTKLFMRGLDSVPAPIAFPFVASSVVLLCFMTDILIWKKTFNLSQKIGFALMIAGIVLLNLG